MSGLSYVVAFGVVTVCIASVIEEVGDILLGADVVASGNSTFGSAIVLVGVICVLPFCYESHILVSSHFFKVPFGSEDHPSDDLVAVLLGNAGSYQLRSGFNGLCFNNYAILGFKSNGNTLIGEVGNEAEICASSEAKHQQSQA